MGTRDEQIDLYDEHMVHIGSGSRRKAHLEGIWHKTFQCWIVGQPGGERSVLMQKRHASKQIFPGKLDKAAAGHLLAGETIEDGLREMEEELGIHVPFTDLIPCGIIPLETYMDDGLIDREFCHVFLHVSDLPLDAYRIGQGEVSGLFWIPLDQYVDLIRGLRQEADASGFVQEDDGRRREVNIRVRGDDLTPQSDAYYQALIYLFEQQGWLPRQINEERG